MKRRVGWGLDIGSVTAKLVRAEETPSGITLKCFGPVPVACEGTGAPDPDALRTSISQLLTKAGASRAHIACCLPRDRATVKFPEFPMAPKEQLARMVRFEAQRYVPFALDEVVLDFQELRVLPPEQPSPGTQPTEPPAQMVELLLAAVRRDVVIAYRRALASAGVRASALSLGSLGTWDLLRYLCPQEQPSLPVEGDPQGEVVLLLDIGGQSTVMSIIAGGVLIFSRSTTVGAEALTKAFEEDFGLGHSEAESAKRERGLKVLDEHPDLCFHIESWLSSLVSEIRRSAAAFTSEHRHRTVDRIYLCGGGAKLPYLSDYLAANLDMRVSPLPTGILLPDLQFAEAAGQALRALGHGVASLDLVPEEIEREHAVARIKRRLQVLGLLAAICTIIGAYVGSELISRHRAEQAVLRRLSQQVDRVVAKAKRLETRQQFLNNQLSELQQALYPKYPVLDVLQELSDRAPQGVWLTGISYEKGKPLVVRGAALSHTLAASYADSLKSSPCFTEVTAGYSNEVTIGEKRVVQFSITGIVKGNEPKARRTTRTAVRTAAR
ncbi:MAG: type IV pilus assembly protein PilM [Armatimonadota bacterium]